MTEPTRSPSSVRIRRLKKLEEYVEAVRLAIEIWELPEFEALSADMFVVASKIGGQALGAYDGERMVSFVVAFPGVKPDGTKYLYSHMMGVLPAYQNRGVGQAIKLRQRQEALSHGWDLIEWTFDPFEFRNAHLNINRLGAIVRRYSLNEWGVTASSLHGGLPTDRCVAEWWLRDGRVESLIKGATPVPPEVEGRVEIPAAFFELRTRNPAAAREIQQEIGERFSQCFERGLTVVGFEKREKAGAYVLSRL